MSKVDGESRKTMALAGKDGMRASLTGMAENALVFHIIML
jgi:hypothetical protein